MRRLGTTDLVVFPLCLGGNVFGWTADEAQAHAVLDAYTAAGGNFIDTADVYARWAAGNSGGESECMIGNWIATRGARDKLVIATKVGEDGGLTSSNIASKAEASLKRLQTDYIDLYYAHWDDPDTELAETMSAFDDLIRAGKVRHAAASNYSAARLSEALAVSRREHLTEYVALQTHYNLLERVGYEGELSELCAREGLACLPYYSLAQGFLTGKYGSGEGDEHGARAAAATAYLDDRGVAVLDVLREVAQAHSTNMAAVALAWLLDRPTVLAPVASARSPDQLAELLVAPSLQLSAQERSRLDAVSA